VARSGRRAAFAALLLAAAPLLAGCVTTQQRNERAKLSAKRLLASRRSLHLGARPADVRVTRVALIRRRRASAVVVEIANRGARPAADVPLEVGVRAGGRRRVLNRRTEYFDNHVASIAPHGRARWVFVTRHALPHGARAYAVAGAPDASLPGRPSALPSLTSTAAPGRPLRVTVRNPGSVPQYGLPVYAFARRGGRYVAAGRAQLDHLGTRATTTIALPLVGADRGAALETEVLPSIFH
jgi:hypothetical protein